ncbi:MAG: hypothetical protein ACXWXO_18630 [Nocardioides sp.]
MGDDVVEKFHPTSGRITGFLALAMVVAIVAIGLLDQEQGFPPSVMWAAIVVGVVVWSAMLRPRLWVTSSDVVMRNMFSTVWVPLVAIEQIIVRQVVALRAGDKRYVSPAVGKSWRQTLKSSKEPKPGATQSYPAFVEERLSQLAEEARAKAGVKLMSDEQLVAAAGVRRSWAWPELAALAATLIGFVVTLLV